MPAVVYIVFNQLVLFYVGVGAGKIKTRALVLGGHGGLELAPDA